MNEKTALQDVSQEIMRFMRGKYVLDEVSDGKDELKFRRGGKTILTVYIRDNRYDFLVIFGKAEREKFETRRNEFPKTIQDIYDNSKTYHDGKWMMFPVEDLSQLEAVKQLVQIKKKPNRKPLPKEQAIYGDCGHRCDLCVHYNGSTISDELREELIERVRRVYSPNKTFEEAKASHFLCPGCKKAHSGDPDVVINSHTDGSCEQKKCASNKGVGKCVNCGEYPCNKAVAGYRRGIEARSILADDVTWAILPYVEGQYGN